MVVVCQKQNHTNNEIGGNDHKTAHTIFTLKRHGRGNRIDGEKPRVLHGNGSVLIATELELN